MKPAVSTHAFWLMPYTTGCAPLTCSALPTAVPLHAVGSKAPCHATFCMHHQVHCHSPHPSKLSRNTQSHQRYSVKIHIQPTPQRSAVAALQPLLTSLVHLIGSSTNSKQQGTSDQFSTDSATAYHRTLLLCVRHSVLPPMTHMAGLTRSPPPLFTTTPTNAACYGRSAAAATS